MSAIVEGLDVANRMPPANKVPDIDFGERQGLARVKNSLNEKLERGLKMTVINKNISELIPYANNPRKNGAAVDKVAASIKEF